SLVHPDLNHGGDLARLDLVVRLGLGEGRLLQQSQCGHTKGKSTESAHDFLRNKRQRDADFRLFAYLRGCSTRTMYRHFLGERTGFARSGVFFEASETGERRKAGFVASKGWFVVARFIGPGAAPAR